jgi:hypothetical protein
MNSQQGISEPKVMPGLTEGRIVHFVMPNDEHRPAIIVKVWDHGQGTVNLQVFTDGSNDNRVVSGEESVSFNLATEAGIMWRTSIVYREIPERNTWHWIEPA